MKVPPWFPKLSTLQYLALAAAYWTFWAAQMRGAEIPSWIRYFLENMVFVDIAMNMASPWLYGIISLLLSMYLQGREFGASWVALMMFAGFPFIAFFLLMCWMVFGIGGWMLLASSLVVMARLNWFALQRKQGAKAAALALFVRGWGGIFFFLVPPMIFSAWYAEKHGIYLKDAGMLQGGLYFTLQAAFEEAMLRLMDRYPQLVDRITPRW